MPTLTKTSISEAVEASRRKWGGKPRYNIRWLLAHDPPVVFEDAAVKFVESVADRTKGEIAIEPVTTKDYFAGHGGEFRKNTDTLQVLRSGEVQMAHTYLASLGSLHKRIWGLDLPFLFRDHGHAMRVLDGPIGQELMQSLLAMQLRGIAYAYSGGYRIIPTTGKEIRRVEDFKGLRLRTAGNPMTTAFLESLGAIPVSAPLEQIRPLLKQDKIEAAETTYVRYWAQGLMKECPVLNETQHSLFMTILLVNEEYFQSLPKALREIIRECGFQAALEEREKSIDFEEELKRTMPKDGVRILPMSEEEKRRLRRAADPTYARFEPEFGVKFVRSIQEHS